MLYYNGYTNIYLKINFKKLMVRKATDLTQIVTVSVHFLSRRTFKVTANHTNTDRKYV